MYKLLDLYIGKSVCVIGKRVCAYQSQQYSRTLRLLVDTRPNRSAPQEYASIPPIQNKKKRKAEEKGRRN